MFSKSDLKNESSTAGWDGLSGRFTIIIGHNYNDDGKNGKGGGAGIWLGQQEGRDKNYIGTSGVVTGGSQSPMPQLNAEAAFFITCNPGPYKSEVRRC